MGRKRTQEEYDLLLKKENPTIIRIGTYHRMDEKLDHKCLVCGHEWKVFPSSLTGKKHSGCPICNGGTDIVVVGKNDMWTTNPELAKLLATLMMDINILNAQVKRLNGNVLLVEKLQNLKQYPMYMITDCSVDHVMIMYLYQIELCIIYYLLWILILKVKLFLIGVNLK